jgi:hypothetical protein
MALTMDMPRRAALRLVWTGSAIAVAVLAVAAPGAASAAPGLVVAPRPAGGAALSYFRLSAAPGHAARAGAIVLLNRSGSPLRVAIGAVAGRTIDTLGSTYGPPGSAPRGAAAWLRLGERRLTLAPGGSAQVPVSVTVPPGAPSGDRLAGVAVEALGQRQEAANRGVAIASTVRYVIGVEVTVPGPRSPLIRFTGASLERQPSALVFLLRARNAGNVILRGVHGAVRITSRHHLVASMPLGPGTFVTSSSIAYPVPAPRAHPAAGTVFRVRAYLRYGSRVAWLDTLVRFGHAAAAKARTYAPRSAAGHGGSGLPGWAWGLLGGALLYGAAATLAISRLRRRRLPPALGAAVGPPPPHARPPEGVRPPLPLPGAPHAGPSAPATPSQQLAAVSADDPDPDAPDPPTGAPG